MKKGTRVSDYEWTVEVTPAARAAISRAIKDRYDGRELGGALVGHTYGDRIVVTDANGLGCRRGNSARRDLVEAVTRALVRVRASLWGRALGRLALSPRRR